MNTLKKLILSLHSLKTYSLKRLMWLFFTCVIGIFVLSSAFLSCSPGFDALPSENETPPDETKRRTTTTEKDDGDQCEGNETCERVCEAIYEIYSEQVQCMDEGDIKVGRLEKIHDILMKEDRNKSDIENDLQKITDGEEDIDVNDFDEYLQIGGTKWVTEIEASEDSEDNRLGENVDNLKEILKWLIETDEEAAEILSEVDDGSKILEALLLRVAESCSSSLPSKISASVVSIPAYSGTEINLWGLNAKEVKFGYYKKSDSKGIGVVTLKVDKDAELYDALSCKIEDDSNVFSYAADEDNQIIFDIAFESLSELCDKAEGTTGNKDPQEVCIRTLMCWTAWQFTLGTQSPGPSNSSTTGFWKMLENKHSDFGSGDCGASDFGEFL